MFFTRNRIFFQHLPFLGTGSCVFPICRGKVRSPGASFIYWKTTLDLEASLTCVANVSVCALLCVLDATPDEDGVITLQTWCLQVSKMS